VPKQNKSNYFFCLRGWIIGFVVSLVLVSGAIAQKRLEWVVLKYRFLRERVSVPELTTFVQTGRTFAIAASLSQACQERTGRVAAHSDTRG
jgi:hypothetical protein